MRDGGGVVHRRILHLFEQTFVGTVVAAGNHQECGHPATLESFGIELAKRVHHYVQTFVGIFVAATCSYKEGGVVVFLAAHQSGYFKKLAAGCFAGLRHVSRSGSDALLESVGGHDVDLPAEELLAFYGCKVADCREDVSLLRSGFLERVAGHHAVFDGQFVGLQFRKLVVEREILGADATADDCRVGGEDRSDGNVGRFQEEQAGAGHPFVELRYDFLS